MRILILSPFPPHPFNGGGRMRLWEQVQYLSQHHRLTVVSFFLPEEGEMKKQELEAICERVIFVHLDPPPVDRSPNVPQQIHQYNTDNMHKTLRVILSYDFDVVITEHIYMAQYHSLFSAYPILQEHNIESKTLRRFIELERQSGEQIYETDTRAAEIFRDADREYTQLAEYENQIWPIFPLRITVSDNDKREMDRRCMVGKTIIVPNGINTRSINLIPYDGSKKILFMGTLDYYPNVDAIFYFVNHILPKIWQKNLGVQFCIAGRNPSRALQELASHSQIEVIAYPKDMNRIARTCSLTVVPMRIGGGTRIKILHALAMGLPVLSTSLGCEGLSVVNREHILIEDDPDTFADAVLQLLSDQSLASHLRMNGRKLVEEKYDWRIMFEHLETEILSSVVQR